jgi:hypothetical protein
LINLLITISDDELKDNNLETMDNFIDYIVEQTRKDLTIELTKYYKGAKI